MSQRATHLRPLVFDFLLHTPVLCLASDVLSGPGFPVHPLLLGLTGAPSDRMYMLFSDMRYGTALAHKVLPRGSGQHLNICPYDSGIDLLAQLLPTMDEPFVVDLLQPHAIAFLADETRAWMNAWKTAALPTNPLRDGHCGYAYRNEPPCQVLLDRLAAYFACWPGVERAHLIGSQAGNSPLPFEDTLVLKCDDVDAIARIERALPLLNFGLPANEPPITSLIRLDRYPRFEAAVQHVAPVYDRATSRWPSSSATPLP